MRRAQGGEQRDVGRVVVQRLVVVVERQLVDAPAAQRHADNVPRRQMRVAAGIGEHAHAERRAALGNVQPTKRTARRQWYFLHAFMLPFQRKLSRLNFLTIKQPLPAASQETYD